MVKQKQYVTVYSYNKQTKFDEFSGHMDIVYVTYEINNGIPMREGSGRINRSECKNFEKYIIDLYKDKAMAHTVDKI